MNEDIKKAKKETLIEIQNQINMGLSTKLIKINIQNELEEYKE